MKDVLVRQMRGGELEEADAIMRNAFGTYLGLPEPLKFMGDADFVKTRFAANPPAAIAAEVDGKIVGSNFLLDWGSVGVFGPLTIHPDYWDMGIANRLLEQTMKIFAAWGTRHVGLFTFAQSSKHVHLYQKFGFWPRFLTAVMSKPLDGTRSAKHARFSALSPDERKETFAECLTLTDRLYPGLDLRKEIVSVLDQKLGDTILLRGDTGLQGLAICHTGPNTEAGSGNCYVKFAAVAPSGDAGTHFNSLMDACEQYAHSSKASRITAGANAGRHKQYRRMIERGFRTEMQGVTMHNPNEPGYNTEDAWIVDDWR